MTDNLDLAQSEAMAAVAVRVIELLGYAAIPFERAELSTYEVRVTVARAHFDDAVDAVFDGRKRAYMSVVGAPGSRDWWSCSGDMDDHRVCVEAFGRDAR